MPSCLFCRFTLTPNAHISAIAPEEIVLDFPLWEEGFEEGLGVEVVVGGARRVEETEVRV